VFRRTAIRKPPASRSKLHARHAVIYQFIPNASVRVMERLIRSMGPEAGWRMEED
jgi:hypothetical protein